MNEDNLTRALTVYVPPKQKLSTKFAEFRSKMNLHLFYLFRVRVRTYCVLFCVFALMLFYTVILSKVDYGFGATLLRAFSTESGKHCVLFSLIVVIISGFTVFGRIISVLFDMLIAFAVGLILSHSYAFNLGDHFFALILNLFVSLLVFFSIVFCAEVFCFSRRAMTGKSAFTLKGCTVYVAVALIFTFLIHLLLNFILYY